MFIILIMYTLSTNINQAKQKHNEATNHHIAAKSVDAQSPPFRLIPSADEFVNNCDLFARPIRLTFKGHDSIRTTVGGLASLILMIFMFSTFIRCIQDLNINNEKQATATRNSQSIYNNYLNEVQLQEQE